MQQSMFVYARNQNKWKTLGKQVDFDRIDSPNSYQGKFIPKLTPRNNNEYLLGRHTSRSKLKELKEQQMHKYQKTQRFSDANKQKIVTIKIYPESHENSNIQEKIQEITETNINNYSPDILNISNIVKQQSKKGVRSLKKLNSFESNRDVINILKNLKEGGQDQKKKVSEHYNTLHEALAEQNNIYQQFKKLIVQQLQNLLIYFEETITQIKNQYQSQIKKLNSIINKKSKNCDKIQHNNYLQINNMNALRQKNIFIQPKQSFNLHLDKKQLCIPFDQNKRLISCRSSQSYQALTDRARSFEKIFSTIRNLKNAVDNTSPLKINRNKKISVSKQYEQILDENIDKRKLKQIPRLSRNINKIF